ncbi:MAG: tetratricopeptide repeat protein [Gammaproteobacteria bacterium]|nr:tetratricopeptide repeat protein [Gammaproteobacteria bacterium]NNF50417.1 tetratricopeptide repeat protein [Woeseiaceae bacterium]MBT8094420.1 tetratricopeptide repeat protein [Gammaproteobacteria bacterium]MBT8104759.1 tetratricopeptide repeat protein [Gammaproteobacteria bacterium]NNK24773.1 tetratricopeptide repeat protein [Woeseiaceae bacterium]
MLLRRLSNQFWLAGVLAALLVLAGCGATTPARGPSADDGRSAVRGIDGTGIPPKALTQFERAAAVMAAGDLGKAEKRFTDFVLLYPDYPGAWVNLAIIHAGNGHDDKAREAIDSALAVNPDHAPALNQMGMLHRRNGNFLEAEAAYLKAVTVSPGYALAHYNLGVLNELYLQRLDAALQHFEIYQSLVGEDKQVERWIKDLKRRGAVSQQTANVAD